jgi:hypothetical protein
MRSADARREVHLFLAESSKEEDIFPWKGKSKAVDRIVRLGKPVGPLLVEELQDIERSDCFGDVGPHFDWAVQQNITVALCRIYGVSEAHGKHVYCVRAGRSDNSQVYKFWKNFLSGEQNKKQESSSP